MKKQRRSKRHKIVWEVLNKKKQPIGYIEDISWLGCKLMVDKEADDSDINEIIIPSADRDITKDVEISCKLVWKKESNPFYNEMGCQFFEIKTQESFREMLLYVQKMNEAEKKPFEENRRFLRISTIWEVLNLKGDIIGYLKDISWSGCRILVNKNISYSDISTIIFPTPNQDLFEKVVVKAEIIWKNEFLPDYNIVGCKFTEVETKGAFLQLLFYVSNNEI